MLKAAFGFAEYQEKTTLGLGYKLTVTRNSDSAVLNKDNGNNKAETKTISFEWYAPHHNPSITH